MNSRFANEIVNQRPALSAVNEWARQRFGDAALVLQTFCRDRQFPFAFIGGVAGWRASP